MKVLVQKVISAEVKVNQQIVSQIKNGLLLFIGIEKSDNPKQADFLARKVINLRIFTDENDKMNLSVLNVKGEILVVSQFTLAANLNCGNRPGFDTAAAPKEAETLYEYFVFKLKEFNIAVKTGIFQADMKVSLINDGPATFILEK